MRSILRPTLLALAALAALGLAGPALSQPKPTFPPLTGRVVDQANLLSARTEQDLTGRLASLQTQTGRQLVVVTLPTLQGYEIEEYGYQLGRTWDVGSREDDDGALFIVAPNDRQVRVEVGYGLEPVLTDAMSSMILEDQVLPAFRDGRLEEGVVAGASALIEQLSLPEAEAKARVAQAVAPSGDTGGPPILVVILVIAFIIFSLGRGGRRRSHGLGGALPWIILGSLSSGGGGRRGGFGGGGLSGGGGFSGGGGSFGGGGASGRW